MEQMIDVQGDLMVVAHYVPKCRQKNHILQAILSEDILHTLLNDGWRSNLDMVCFHDELILKQYTKKLQTKSCRRYGIFGMKQYGKKMSRKENTHPDC